MKHVIFAGLMTLVPMTAMAAASSVQDKVTYTCNGWQSGQNEPLIGSQVAIVTKVNDLTGAKEVLIRTGAVVPNPVYNYEVLTKVSQNIENAQYESDKYMVDFFFMGGLRAHIQDKRSLTYSNCVAVKR